MKKPRDLISTPRGDWRYYQEQTDMHFRHQHPRALMSEVFQHRLANPDLNLDTTGGWENRLLDEICQQNEYLDCEDTEDPGRWPNLVDAVNWVKSMNDWRKTGLETVPQEEAERRAAICKACPHNRILSACWGCHGVGEVVHNLTGGKTTSIDPSLHVCDVCLCVIKAKVHLPREVIHTEGLQDKFPSFCWLKEDKA